MRIGIENHTAACARGRQMRVKHHFLRRTFGFCNQPSINRVKQILCRQILGIGFEGDGYALALTEFLQGLLERHARIDGSSIVVMIVKECLSQRQIIGDDIHIPAQDLYEIQKYMDGGALTIYDHPWPGFTPDLLSIVLVTAIQAKGSILIHQKMFESRLFFVDKLIEMGAQVILCDPHRAVVVGLEREQQLRGITMSSPDIRAGVALLIAALSAQGKSTIQNIEQIDRGYQNIDIRLQQLGADITRII